MSDLVNQALVNLMKDCISFEEAIEETSSLSTLLNLVQKEAAKMAWLVCLIGEKMPQLVSRRIHEYLILGFASFGNPYLGTSDNNDDLKNMVYITNHLFIHLLNHSEEHKNIIINSVVCLFNQYIIWIQHNEPLTTELQKYTLGYLLSLPKISPALFEQSWSIIFRRLYNDAGDIYLYEKNTKNSLVKNGTNIEDVCSLFPRWLSIIAFVSQGLVMKHAMDVAIMLDTLAHDPRLELRHLIPTGDASIMDTLRPSFEQLDLKPASMDLIQWAISLLSTKKRGANDLKIPLFLLQLVLLKSEEMQAVDMLVQLITRLDKPVDLNDSSSLSGARYLILNLVSSAESKWINIFQLVLENIFSRAIAMHIVDSGGSINVEKILGNLAMLFEPLSTNQDNKASPGFQSFQTYITCHWRQVLLLFLNHPSIECRAMGYRVLTNSRFWENCDTVEGCDSQTISKLLIDAWFRLMKGRYQLFIGKEIEDRMVVNEQQRLIANCCQHEALAKIMLSFTLDGILGGGLELFPATNSSIIKQEDLCLLDQVRKTENEGRRAFYRNMTSTAWKPPQFVASFNFENQEEDLKNKIYVDNIERTATLFFQFDKQFYEISLHVLSRLKTIWMPETVSLEKYDDVLPMNIPYQSDIVIGSAFKDHPVLFVMFEKYYMNQDYHFPPYHDIIRSVLVYFIVFWHMKEVTTASTTLRFATQLEETIRLVFLLKPMLPDFFVYSYQVFPFLSAKDLGDVLFKVIWHYLRWQSSLGHIPGIKATAASLKVNNDEELKKKCKKRLLTICENRLGVLENAPSWHQTLSNIISKLQE
ncbi:uncharacterized protein BX663DRAFT_506527 [Cokeromyces recurvatus]|uniref:uncharacterized protein n=1 Tax=Cokeromyces recurvatus TaxID=90255 RepID=UPI00221F4D06|nr:uncharacterized protein BX663DRAFT_506527 [Cokeromyces recurvatus]KAI7903443.1 hypothetical protein BX663DRAFT_506527 [Cokeromyces recurvatus]